MLKKIIMPAIAGLILVPAIASSATVQELENRILKLEEEAGTAIENIYDINTRADDQMEISGYVDSEFHSHTNENNDRFRIHHLSLFFEKNLGEKWRFFSEVEYEDGPKLEGTGDGDPLKHSQGKIFLESVHLTYLWRQELNARVGRMFTPAGIWSVDHYPTFVPTQERPQHIRAIFPQIVDGSQVFGTASVGSAFVNYDLYVGNGNGNTGKGDKNQSKAKGAKLSFVFPALDHFELGASYYIDPKDSSAGDKELVANGIHGKFRKGPVTLQLEKATGDYDDVKVREGYYAQLRYDWDDYVFGVRHDYYDKDLTAVTEQGKTQNSVFVNYRANSNVTLKVEYHAIDFDDNATDSFGKTIFSIVGYLGN